MVSISVSISLFIKFFVFSFLNIRIAQQTLLLDLLDGKVLYQVQIEAFIVLGGNLLQGGLAVSQVFRSKFGRYQEDDPQVTVGFGNLGGTATALQGGGIALALGLLVTGSRT